MHLARVVGTVVCTHKDARLTGVKLLLIQPVKRCLNARGGREPISATAASTSTAGSAILSTRPIVLAELADSVRPVSIMSIAFGAPTRRGRRALPPQPGKMPSFTSGRPMRVDGSLLATR